MRVKIHGSLKSPAGLGVALVPEQLKKLPHKNVVFRPVMPAVATEACVAWKAKIRLLP
jgi:hypothetical protein